MGDTEKQNDAGFNFRTRYPYYYELDEVTDEKNPYKSKSGEEKIWGYIDNFKASGIYEERKISFIDSGGTSQTAEKAISTEELKEILYEKTGIEPGTITGFELKYPPTEKTHSFSIIGYKDEVEDWNIIDGIRTQAEKVKNVFIVSAGVDFSRWTPKPERIKVNLKSGSTNFSILNITYDKFKRYVEDYLANKSSGILSEEGSELRSDTIPSVLDSALGKNKKLDLRIFTGSVNEILSYLKNGRYRKDLLFTNSTSWEKFNSDITLNNKIFLVPDNFTFKGGFKYSLGNVTDVTNTGPFKVVNNLAGGAAMIDAISKYVKNNSLEEREEGMSISFNERVNKFRNLPYIKDVDNVNIDSLSFTFQYGQFGLYSCVEEVYKPIAKMAQLFAPYYADANMNKNGDAANFVYTNYDNKFSVMTKMYESLITGFGGEIKNVFDNRDEETFTERITSAIQNLPEGLAKILNNAANSAKTQIIMFSIGSAIYGPYYVSSCNWEFDNSIQDENFMPYKGTVTLNGIQSLLVEGPIQLLSTAGGVLGKKEE